MSPIRRYHIGALSMFFVIFAVLATVPVTADEIDTVKQEAGEISELAKGLGTRFLGADGFKSRHYAEERLIDGENFYRLKDYQRAAIIFMDIIESYSGHAAYPDALFYFADSLFLSRDFYGARQWFNRLLNESGRPGMGRFQKKAIERLIEIGIHVNDFEGVEKYFDQLGQARIGAYVLERQLALVAEQARLAACPLISANQEIEQPVAVNVQNADAPPAGDRTCAIAFRYVAEFAFYVLE